MKHLIFLTLTMLTLTPSFAAVSNEKGNGGDSVICDGKMRTLDSVMMNDQNLFTIIKNKDYQSSLTQIINHLNETYPFIAQELEEFLDTYNKKFNSEENTYWIKGAPLDVKDENLYVDVPDFCSNKLIQTVVRVEEPYLRYYYNPKVLSALENQGDELSWLLIHEWLRYGIEDAEVIRVLNGYFHSLEFQNSNEDIMSDYLFKFRFDNDRQGDRTDYGLSRSVINAQIEKMDKAIKEIETLMKETRQIIREFISAGSIPVEIHNVFKAKIREKISLMKSGIYGGTYASRSNQKYLRNRTEKIEELENTRKEMREFILYAEKISNI